MSSQTAGSHGEDDLADLASGCWFVGFEEVGTLLGGRAGKGKVVCIRPAHGSVSEIGSHQGDHPGCDDPPRVPGTRSSQAPKAAWASRSACSWASRSDRSRRRRLSFASLDSGHYLDSISYVNYDQQGSRRLTRAEAKARTREQLLEAAARVFAEKGFSGASVEEVAAAAGYSTGALYSNFASKDELFVVLMTARQTRRVAAAAETWRKAATGDEEPLAVLGQLFVEQADHGAEFALLQAEFWLYAMRKPFARRALVERLTVQAEDVRQLLEAVMRRSGVPASVPPALVTTVVIALFQGLVRRRQLDPASVPEDLFAQALQWLLRGLRDAS